MSIITLQIFYYLLLIVVVIASVWVTRAIMARDKPNLQPWHFVKLESEFTAKKYPNGLEFSEYQALELRLVEEIKEKIERPLAENQKIAINRFNPASQAHRQQWTQDWNLSFERIPEKRLGAIVLLHGASDSPYSMRALSQQFFELGLVVVAVRLPGNGTIPGELTRVRPDDWSAVVPMGVNRARQLVAQNMPVFIGGYSTGATLAIDYVLTCMASQNASKIAGLLFFSPAVQVSAAARFAAWDNFFSRFKVFRKFAWLTIWPEYDPFKYSSFAKRAVSVVRELTAHNTDRIDSLKKTDDWSDFPPVLTFQSVVDATVSVPSVFDFHVMLDNSLSQLVVFDVNRQSSVAPFLDDDSAAILDRAVTEEFDSTDITIVRNDSVSSSQISAYRYSPENDNVETATDLHVQWPEFVVSLSHVAVPFPEDDLLYGKRGSGTGYNLNNIHVKGEKAVLLVPAEDINRIRYNPFFQYMGRRISDFVLPLIKAD